MPSIHWNGCSGYLLCAVVLLIGLPAAAATPWQAHDVAKGGDHLAGVPIAGDRLEGDTIADALPIAALPFLTTGNSCVYTNDYDEFCPHGGSNSPDVVYVYEELIGTRVTIDLCASLYDTKVFIYDIAAGYGPGNPIACNDDANCGYNGYQSQVTMNLAQGHTYHIVVDGYGSDCGQYELHVYEIIEEILECPAGALLEGEPDCYDGYLDVFNGGCNSTPPVYSTLAGSAGGAPFSVCGTSGNFSLGSTAYRDTDWYEITLAEPNTISVACAAQFPVAVYILDGNQGCEDVPVLDYANAGVFPDQAELTYAFAAGTYWLWIGPSVFNQVPCGSLYVMTITGYEGQPVSTQGVTWTAVKGRFR
jgi:hypothetical protein